MSTHDALASLKINRTPQRHGWRVWPWVALILVFVGAISAAPYYRAWQAVEVSVAPVAKVNMASSETGATPGNELSAAGYVVADRQSTLAAKVTGRLVKLNVSEAQRVKAGEVLAEIDHHELDAHILEAHAGETEIVHEVERLRKVALQAEAELASARAPFATIESEILQINITLEDARRRLKRDLWVTERSAMPSGIIPDLQTEVRLAEARIVTAQQRKLEQEKRAAVAEAQLEVARTSIGVAEARQRSAGARIKVLQAQLEDAFIRAPFDGVITEKAAELGEIIAPISVGGAMARGSIVTVADWNSLQAEVDVAEAYIGRVNPSGRAAITVDAFPDKIYPGKVRRVLPRANRSKATVQVRVDFLQRDERVLPEMGVRVKFLGDEAPPGAETGAMSEKLVIPKTALQGSLNSPFVWVVANGLARKQPVAVGVSTGDFIEVKIGIGINDTVVSQGAEKLSQDGQKVSIKNY